MARGIQPPPRGHHGNAREIHMEEITRFDVTEHCGVRMVVVESEPLLPDPTVVVSYAQDFPTLWRERKRSCRRTEPWCLRDRTMPNRLPEVIRGLYSVTGQYRKAPPPDRIGPVTNFRA